MKAPRPAGAPIDARRKRRWSGNFASYRHQVSNDAISEWLDQFSDQDRDVAARVLDVVEFYSIDRISAAFKTALAGLPGWHIDADQREGKWRFAAMAGSAGESGDAMMHRFRVANRLDGKAFKELFIHPSQILLQGLGPDDTLVLVDDFVGTGDTVCTAWRESFAELVAGIGRVYLIVVAAKEQARDRIGNETSITCVPAHELTDSDMFFAGACTPFSDADKETILRYCERADKKQPRGYGDCGFVVVFQHRCPNNSLPILHVENRRWTGLFPRHG